MTGTRPATPTPNTFSTNLSPSSRADSTTLRNSPSAHSTSRSLATEEEQTQSSNFTEVHSLPPQLTSASSSDRRMTQRLQGEQTFSGQFVESSDSPKDRIGTREVNEQQSGTSEPTAPPPKKKRTRTLTTPHQAAVLHALLAKSRFPNTHVREEVGRSIGLSARKVQIWFQNQRQKARRPRSQSTISRRKSHQFGGSETAKLGSFPLAPEASSSSSAPMPRSTEMGRPVAPEYYSPNVSSDRGGSSSQLLGPGMPGIEPSSDLMYREQRVIPPRPSTAYEGPTRYSEIWDQTMRSPNLAQRYLLSPPVPRPATAGRLYERDPSRTLPPLVFPPAPLRTSFFAPGPDRSSGPSRAATLAPAYGERRSLSPMNMFAYQPPESAAPIMLPPPYVVEPQPHWPSSSYESTLRSSHSPSWALQVLQSASRSVTPPAPTAEQPPTVGVATIEEEHQPPEVRPPQRSGRYDPIRGTFTYSSPPEDH